MPGIEFESSVESFLEMNNVSFTLNESFERCKTYLINLGTSLLEIQIWSDSDIRINLPRENDGVSFGGSDEVYDNYDDCYERVKEIVSDKMF